MVPLVYISIDPPADIPEVPDKVLIAVLVSLSGTFGGFSFSLLGFCEDFIEVPSACLQTVDVPLDTTGCHLLIAIF